MFLTQAKTLTTILLGAVVVAGTSLVVYPGMGLQAADSPPKTNQAGKVALLRVPERGIQPQVVVDGKGIIHALYFRGDPAGGDVFYVRSEDSGAHFSSPLRVNSQPGSVIAIGSIRGAHLALGKNGRVHVAWNGSGKAEPKGPGNASPMLYTRLNDKGTAFEPQRNIIQTAFGLDGGGSVGADDAGNVWVSWHAPEPGSRGEANRRIWVTRSTDEGQTFAAEKPVSEGGTGVCGCCGMKALGDRKGNVYLLYRSAAEVVHRDSYLLLSRDQGAKFQSDKVEAWNVGVCPMSSYALTETSAGILAAWETDGRVSYVRLDPQSGQRSAPVSAPGSGGGRKHPAVASNSRGETILVWTEGTGWNRGGAVAWQVFDRDGKPTADRGRVNGVPVWSMAAVFPRPDGGFTVVY